MTTTTEQSIIDKLDELKNGQDSLKRGQELMHTELFGKPDDENEHGRLPRVERKVQADNVRITKLERLAIKISTLTGALVLLIEAAHLFKH